MSVLRGLKQQIRDGTANLDVGLSTIPDGNNSLLAPLIDCQIDDGNEVFNDNPLGSQDMAEVNNAHS
jgi:hypothetical protein